MAKPFIFMNSIRSSHSPSTKISDKLTPAIPFPVACNLLLSARSRSLLLIFCSHLFTCRARELTLFFRKLRHFVFLCGMPVRKAAAKIVPPRGSVARVNQEPQVERLREASKPYCFEVMNFSYAYSITFATWPISF